MIRPGLNLARVAGRRFASTAAAGENEFIAKRQAMRDHAVRACFSSISALRVSLHSKGEAVYHEAES